MTKPLPRQLLVLGLLWAASASPWAQVPARTVQHEAQGSFEVQMTPQGSGDEVDGVRLGRMALSKTFRGALVGSGQGEMLTALTPIKGSAGYVALERVTGVLRLDAAAFEEIEADKGATGQACFVVIGASIAAGRVCGGMTIAASPECTPAYSMCSSMPPTTEVSPSLMQSTSSSIASSRNLSISTGLPGMTSNTCRTTARSSSSL